MIRINCDLCGKIDERLHMALIEGVDLNVCSDCCKFGKILNPIKKRDTQTRKIAEKEDKTELLVDDYPSIIKSKRESMGLTQKEFANKMNEKEATIHKIETGALAPSLPLAKKLEKFLVVRLVEEYEEKKEIVKKKLTGEFTIGDFITLSKK